ncbi:MAG: cytochrome C oxidase subunit IV family protein [Epsilonproteobacteria bacterium]|nr:cytochrome C oxidase subunit IV family protein [Campylobacterota bacterium]
MGTNTTVNYEVERKRYYKVLVELLLLTTLTFVQPYIFHAGTFTAQMLIAVVKAWLILMYYMHLKGEKLIGSMTMFSMALVLVFFIIVIAVDVTNFQFTDESYITSTTPGAEVTSAHTTHGGE